MEIAHILEELAFDMGSLPREAIEAAVAKKDQLTPHLLQILEAATENIEEIIEYDNYQGHLFSMYLLAQFREKKAYPILIKLLSFPGEIPHAILGDVLTEDLCRIIASVQDGNIDPIKKLIENPATNLYVRTALLSSLVILVGYGLKARSEILHYFQNLMDNSLERKPSFVWDHLMLCACELYPDELIHSMQKAYQDQLVDPTFLSLEDVGNILTKRKEIHLFQLLKNTELIEDTVIEMEKWLHQQPPTSPMLFSDSQEE